MSDQREELYDALFQIAANYNVPLTNNPDMHREMPSIGDFCGDLEATFRAAGYGVANGIKAQALREAAEDYSVNLTAMSGPRIRDWLRARADELEGGK